MEEIDIIELLKREKEGKTPKKIEINGTSYALVPNYKVRGIQYWYSNEINMFYEYWFDNKNISTDTKIKILDKPILKEINIITHDDGEEGFFYSDEDNNLQCECSSSMIALAKKINEIIRYLRSKDER